MVYCFSHICLVLFPVVSMYPLTQAVCRGLKMAKQSLRCRQAGISIQEKQASTCGFTMIKDTLQVVNAHECAAVLQQIAAIRCAVNGLMGEVIKGHLTEHIVHQSDEARREEDLDVILKVLDSYIK